jgi:hypothetical protein
MRTRVAIGMVCLGLAAGVSRGVAATEETTAAQSEGAAASASSIFGPGTCEMIVADITGSGDIGCAVANNGYGCHRLFGGYYETQVTGPNDNPPCLCECRKR